MRILGVDPGTWRTGAGVVESRGNQYRLIEFQIIHVKEKLPIALRLLQIHRALSELLDRHRPDAVALESVFFGKDVQALVKIGEARACAMLAASERGLEVVEYAPARVKQAVTGNGRATKEQVQQMVKVLLNLDALPPPDGADALAAAICHFHSAARNALCTTP